MASSNSPGVFSKEFYDLVKGIGESRSKSEEDGIITREVKLLKQRLAEKGGAFTADNKKKKELLVRLMYVELLGHDASFGYVHAVQLTASQDLSQKRVGYLCCSLFLSPEHEFRFMLVNQLNRDMQSANMLEVAAALVAACKLLTVDSLPALLPTITELLKHEQNIIRKKAVMALHRCYQLSPEAISHLTESFRRTLCDKDPSVMGAALVLLHDLAKADPAAHKDLVPSYASILKQIVEHRLPREFDYHRIPAPWIQIKLLQIFAVLGKNDQKISEGIYAVIHDCMRRADTGINVGYAIVYECVKTVTTIYPNTVLLDAASSAISRFITSENNNLKYLGVTGLAAIVRDHPRYAAAHQMVVLDCLEDPDETLKRKTLDLLFRMTNPVNAEVIVAKLLVFLGESKDKYLRSDLVSRITQLAERYSPDNIWYIKTMTQVFELGGDLVNAEVPHTVLRLLAEGTDDAGDREMRIAACETFAELLDKPAIADVLLRVVFWTLGEYAFLLGEEKLPMILGKICRVIEQVTSDSITRSYGVSALLKISAQLGLLQPEAANVIDKYAESLGVDLQQRCCEFRELARNLQTLRVVLPVDASCEDFGDVVDMGFLDSFVDMQRKQGALEYTPPQKEPEDQEEETEIAHRRDSGLRFDAYETPKMPDPASFAGADELSYDERMRSTLPSASSEVTNNPSQDSAQTGLRLQGVKNVWGKDGYSGGSGVNASFVQQQQMQLQQLRQQQQQQQSSTSLGITPKSLDGLKSGRVAELTPNYDDYDDDVAPASGNRENFNDNDEDDDEADEVFAPKTTQQATQPPPPLPPKISERERMAAALFGGLGSDGKSSSVEKPRARPQTQPSAFSAREKAAPIASPSAGNTPAPPSLQPPVIDLLGFDDISSSQGGQQSFAPATQSASTPPDLLSDLSFEVPITISPAAAPSISTSATLNPVPGLSTQSYGAQWGAHTAEMRLSVPQLAAGKIDAIASKMNRKIGVATVEIIQATQEAIFAGSTPGAILPMQALVLIHAKCRPSGDAVDFMVRSNRPAETQRVAASLTLSMSSE